MEEEKKLWRDKGWGKYKVTVPKPFEFDRRAKSRTIRERKVAEMVLERQIEEEEAVHHQFRHKPVPAEV